MHNGVTSHLWLKSALHASSHPRMCTCVLRLGCFLLACLVLYFVPPFSFQPFLMFTSALNERSRSNPLCDFRLGTVVTSDHETPLTLLGNTYQSNQERGDSYTNLVRVKPHKLPTRKKILGMIDDLDNVDSLSSNVHFSRQEALLYVFEDNEAMIKMIIKGRSPTMRRVSRSHRVALVV